MVKMQDIVGVVVLLACIVSSVVSLQCYECNVWKAGYGHLCDNPRLRDDCTVCMKTETTVFMGYYKNTPRSSTTISRICGKSRIVHFSHECHRYTTSDGTSVRCYCDSDLCNTAQQQTFSIAFLSLTVIGAVVKNLFLV